MLFIANIDRYDMLNNPLDNKPAVTIWFSGCKIRCKDCQNKKLWDITAGIPYEVSTVILAVEHAATKANTKTIVFLGGEPLDQIQLNLLQAMQKLSEDGYEIWLYTGYEFEDVPSTIKKYAFVIKCGMYVEELKCDGFPSSSNQRVFKKIGGEWQQIK